MLVGALEHPLYYKYEQLLLSRRELIQRTLGATQAPGESDGIQMQGPFADASATVADRSVTIADSRSVSHKTGSADAAGMRGGSCECYSLDCQSTKGVVLSRRATGKI